MWRRTPSRSASTARGFWSAPANRDHGRRQPRTPGRHRVQGLRHRARLLPLARISARDGAAEGPFVADIIVIEGYDGPQPADS